MRRITVVGCPGSGKTTLAGRLADVLGVTHIELDHLHWRPGWTEASPEEFRADLEAAMADASAGWVTCGNYATRSEGRHIAVADTVVWLDFPRHTIMRRVVWRTLRRAVRREELFGRDVREPLTNFYRWSPEKNIIRWAWVHYPRYRAGYEEAIAAGSWAHLDVCHLRSPREVREFVGQAATTGLA